MKKLFVITIVLLAVFFAKSINAKNPNSATKSKSQNIDTNNSELSNISSYEFSMNFGRGWNLGNTLEAIGGETAWGNPLASQRLIDSVKAAGFNSIRIPVAWSKFTDEFSYYIKESWLERVEEVVNYALNNDMYVILNEHWDGGWLQPTYAEEAKARERLEAIWDQVAFHFMDYDEHLIFAGTNEVMVEGNYGTPTKEYYTVQNGFNQLFVNTVRATGGNNATRYLVVQGFNTNIGYTSNFFSMPDDEVENKLIVEVHYYDPFDFTLNSNSKLYVWGDDAPGSQSWANESRADSEFLKMKTKFVDKNIGVIIGEYGAMARLNLGTENNEIHARYRLYWTQYVTESIVRNGLIPYYWDSGYTGNNGSGLFNRTTGAQAYPDIIKAIVDTSYQAPVITSSQKLANGELKIYPNPTANILNVECNAYKVAELSIYNIDGQLIKSLATGNSVCCFDISDLRPGLYFVKISTQKGIITERFMKE